MHASVARLAWGTRAAQAHRTKPRCKMPPKKWRGTWRPKGSLRDPRWLEGAAQRLDRVREGLGQTAEGGASAPSVATPTPDAEPAAASGEPPAAPANRRLAGVRPRGQPTTPAEELAALRLGRSTPSAFNLQRHAVMVCGRPVVVPSLCIRCCARGMVRVACVCAFFSTLMSLPPQRLAICFTVMFPWLCLCVQFCARCVCVRMCVCVCVCVRACVHVSVREFMHAS